MEATLNLDFPVRMNDETGFAFISHDNLQASVYAGTIAAAKTKLRAMARGEIEAALRQKAEYRQAIIGTNSGTVLIVQFRHNMWGYEIAGPGRKHLSGVTGWNAYDDAVEAAKRHAEQSYEGVAWEC